MTTQPRLSELIRKGSQMVDGQCWGEPIQVSKDTGKVRCCALGAAYYALTGERPPSSNTLVTEAFADYPDIGIDDPITDWVMEHNDAGDTFDEIAAALEAKGL